MKKLSALLFCLFLFCAAFCACDRGVPPQTDATAETNEAESESATETETQNNEERPVTLGMYSTDSLNPYKTGSETNRRISALLYDSLFRINENFEAVPSIAESYELEGKKLTVALRNGLCFSDGNEITPSDVAYSFTLAKSSPLYSAGLSNIASCTDSADKVIFTLSVEDIFAVNCLDFPIIERGDGAKEFPAGSGRYTAKKEGGTYILTAAEQSTIEEEMEQSHIELLDLAQHENPLYLLRTGVLSCYFDEDGQAAASKTDASVAKVNLNSLVFLGFNSESEYFSNPKLRRAVSLLVDRQEIAATAYDAMAKEADCVFNPDWSSCASLQNAKSATNAVEAETLLEKENYIYAYSNNKYRSKNFEFFEIILLVNNENKSRVKAAKLIRTRLEKAGIKVNLSSVDFDSYKYALENGDFDLYLGEVRLSANMDFTPFFSSAGKANFGINLSSSVCDAYFDFKSGKIDVSTFVGVFDEELAFLPLCYREGAMYYSRALKYEGAPCMGDIFSNAYSWSF